MTQWFIGTKFVNATSGAQMHGPPLANYSGPPKGHYYLSHLVCVTALCRPEMGQANLAVCVCPLCVDNASRSQQMTRMVLGCPTNTKWLNVSKLADTNS